MKEYIIKNINIIIININPNFKEKSVLIKVIINVISNEKTTRKL